MRALLRHKFLPLAALAALVWSCAHQKEVVQDASYVETLRLKITKVRNALEETREAITASRGAPYLPELYLRLAELLSEEARYHHRVALEREQGSSEALHVPHVRLLKERAIGVYKQILREHPETALADRVLFNIAHEHRELGNFDDMRKYLQQLIQEHPSSPLRTEALLVLGDYHFDRAELTQAKGFYTEITAGPPSRVRALARYKLGWVWVNLGQCKNALGSFEAALKEAGREGLGPKTGTSKGKSTSAPGDQPPDQPADSSPRAQPITDEEGIAIDVRRSALVDLVYCYSQERKAEQAITYLRGLAHDRASYVAALARMARRYTVMDERVGLSAVLRELLRLGPTTQDRLDDARQLFATMRAIGRYEHVGQDVQLINAILTRYLARVDVQEDERRSLRNQFEVYTRDLLTRAQGRFDKLDSKDLKTYAAQLADGYRVYLHMYPEARQLTSMLLNLADVLVAAGDNFEAAARSLQAAGRLEPSDPRRADTLYDAVVRFQEYLRAPWSEVGHLDRVPARAGLRRAAKELLRYKLSPDRQRIVKFGIAVTHYDEGQLAEAIDYLTALAYEYPGTAEADAAVRLVLDSYNTLNDFDGLKQAGRRFLAAASPASDEVRKEIKPLIAAAEQRMLDEVSLEAAGTEGGDLSLLTVFAERHRGSALGERALLNAFLAARAQGDTAQLYRLGGQFAEAYPRSNQLPSMLSTLGQIALARFEIDRAIAFLDTASKSNHPRRGRLLTTAAQFQEQLGHVEEARELYRQAILGTEPRERVEPLRHLARLLERTADPQSIVSTLGPFAEDEVPEVLVRLGLAEVALGQVEMAEQHLQAVLSGAASAPAGVRARAHYGMAEILMRTLDQYPTLDRLDLTEEYITVVDVTHQSFLNAAREADPDYSAAAFGRLAYLSKKAASRLREVELAGEDVTAEQKAQLVAALKKRADELERAGEDARKACAQQGVTLRAFGPVVRACLKGNLPERTTVAFDAVSRRSGSQEPRDAGPLRQRLSRNAEDLDALRRLGSAMLEAGDAHSARLAFMAAAERGGGALESNSLGIASHRVGDISGALLAFGVAAEGGLEAGRQNLATALRKLGLDDAAKDMLARFPKGRAGGQLLGRGAN